MKLTLERDALVDLVQPSLRAVSAPSRLPVLGGLRLDASEAGLELAATDLDAFVSMRGDALVDEAGVAVVFGRLLGEILRSLPAGQVSIAVDGLIRSGRVEFSLTTLPADEFPAVPAAIAGPTCRTDAGELARALGRVVPSASTEEGRPVLAGILWSLEGETLRLVATDSYRLAVAELVVKEGPGEGEMIVPARALSEFGRFLAKCPPGEPAAVTIGAHQAALEAGPLRIVARLVEDTYPDWRRLIPEIAPNRLRVDRRALLEALGRVGLLARANIPVRLDIGDGLRLSARTTGVGEALEDHEPVSYAGDPLSMGFNPRFLVDGLEALDGDQVSIAIVDTGRPVVLTDEAAPFTYLLMPVRLGEQQPSW